MSHSSTLLPPRGFHFTFLTNFFPNTTRPACDLYLLHTFPSDVFVDKYELEEHQLVFNLHGESNLELPLVAVYTGLTLEILVPSSMRVNIPLHARYPLPDASPYSIVHIPEPQAYWACRDSGRLEANPFSHLSSPYTPSLDLNVWSVVFWDSDRRERYHEIQVPAGSKADVMLAESGTLLVVLVAFSYVLWVLWMTNTRIQGPPKLKHE